MVAAFGGAEHAKRARGRRFNVPAENLQRDSGADVAGASGPAVAATDSERDQEGASECSESSAAGSVDIFVPYVALAKVTAVVRIESCIDFLPICKENAVEMLRPPCDRGVGLRNMLGLGKEVFKNCVKKTSEDTRLALRMLE